MDFKNKIQIFKKTYLQVAGILFLLLLAIFLLWFYNSTSMQAIPALPWQTDWAAPTRSESIWISCNRQWSRAICNAFDTIDCIFGE